MKIRIKKSLAALAVSASMLTLASAASARQGNIVYEVEVQNVTAGNVLSPFLAAVVDPSLKLATIGSEASAGVAALAETGNRAVLTQELTESMKSFNVTGAEGGPILPGQTRKVEISVPYEAVHRGARLEVLAMIGRSNDSFISLGGLTLAKVTGNVGSAVRVKAYNLDAGSEENTGNVEDFGSGGHPVDEAEGLISLDRGLNLRGNAPETFAWGSTAAFITIRRVR